MKIEDLRIGNIIECFMHPLVPEWVECEVRIDTLNDISKFPESHGYKPMILTEDLLIKKFHFTKCTDGVNTFYIKIEHTSLRVMRSASETNFWVEIKGVRIHPSSGLQIHQLQNIYFSFTGEELKFEP